MAQKTIISKELKEPIMSQAKIHQFRLPFQEESLNKRLSEKAQIQCRQLLSQMLCEIIKSELESKEENTNE